MYGFNKESNLLVVPEKYKKDIQMFLQEAEVVWDWYYIDEKYGYGFNLCNLLPWQIVRLEELFPLELPTFLSRTNFYGWSTGIDENDCENTEDLPTLCIAVDARKAVIVSEWLNKFGIYHELASDPYTVSEESDRGFTIWHAKIEDIPQNVYKQLISKFGEPFCLDTKYHSYIKYVKTFPERISMQTLA